MEESENKSEMTGASSTGCSKIIPSRSTYFLSLMVFNFLLPVILSAIIGGVEEAMVAEAVVVGLEAVDLEVVVEAAVVDGTQVWPICAGRIIRYLV